MRQNQFATLSVRYAVSSLRCQFATLSVECCAVLPRLGVEG